MQHTSPSHSWVGLSDAAGVYLPLRVATAAAMCVVNLGVVVLSGKSELWILVLLPIPSLIDGLRRRRSQSPSVTVPIMIDITAIGAWATIVGIETIAVAWGLLAMAGSAMLAPTRHTRWIHPYIAVWMIVAFATSRLSTSMTAGPHRRTSS